MAAGISHEINNPLAIIALHIKALDKQKTEQGIERKLWDKGSEKILSTVKRASDIIDALRSFARVDKVEELKEVELLGIIDRTTLLTIKKFEYAGIKFSVDWQCAKDILVMGSEVALSQVLVNLIQNSFYEMQKRDQADERWVKVVISTVDREVKIEVIDAGKGIDDSLVKDLFTPFVTSKPPGEGTGIGLSMSKTMMQKMNGDLTYQKDAAHTTFVITLALANMD
jgi:C4-dicarboxylate-specific signal transduction histidine kinase